MVHSPTLMSTDIATAFPFLRSFAFQNVRSPPPPPQLKCSALIARFLRLQASRPCPRRHLLAYACVAGGGGFGSLEESETPKTSDSKEAVFDIKLPRRSLLVQFTCKSCGERTQRIINRLAYERGTVFVQCAGCLVHHKLVDNLGLIVEYDLQNDKETDCDPTMQS